jgi:tRNA(His) guanylyltransferase
MYDAMGDRLKGYETKYEQMLDVHKPIYVRLDGRAFSTFTSGCQKPFDSDMTEAMIQTAVRVFGKTHPLVAYVQSDEISLLYKAKTIESSVIFGGRLQKLSSVLASCASAAFARHAELINERAADILPHFDGRTCQIPEEHETANMFYWRFRDCQRNAISSVAQSFFSQKELNRKRQGDMLRMLAAIDVNFEGYPAANRFGTFIKRKVEMVGEIKRTRYIYESFDFGKLSHEERVRYLFE